MPESINGDSIDKKIDAILNNEEIRKIINEAGRGEVAPVKRVSDLIGDVYTYCFVHNDGSDLDINDLINYVERMGEAYFDCDGDEKGIQDIRSKELAKSIAQRLDIDILNGTISKEDDQRIQDYFLTNFVENGYVMHSFSGAVEDSIREHGFSSSKRIWDGNKIIQIANMFKEKGTLSPVGAYSYYSGGGMYVENNACDIYWHGLSAPEWFKWFTSANHNVQSANIEDSPYYLRNYEGCKQNVSDLCDNSGLNEAEKESVMEMFEKNWEMLGTERMCVALIPKSVIGKNNREDAIIPGQNCVDTIKTVLSDGRGQYIEHQGNSLKQTVTEKDMIIMGLPNSREIFGEHKYKRETKEELYNPKLVLDMIFRGTMIAGFKLSQEEINSTIEKFRQVHNGSQEVETAIQEYNEKVSNFLKQKNRQEQLGSSKDKIYSCARQEKVAMEKENTQEALNELERMPEEIVEKNSQNLE